MVTPTNPDRQAAISEGRKTYRGKPCYKCGATERYVNGSSCVSCGKLQVALRDPSISKRYHQTDRSKELKKLRGREWRDRQKTGASASGRAYPEFSEETHKTKEREKYVTERKERPTSRQRYELKRKYGMTLEEYNNIVDTQGGACKVCGDTETRLVVDHCHESGNIRELLCSRCNTALGFARDSVDILRGLADYIMRHKEV